MKLSFTEPVCSGGAVLPPLRGHSQLRFLMKVSLVYISMMIATLQLLASSGKGQNLDQLKVTTELNHESLSVLFRQIQRQTNLTFAFIPNEISPYNNVTIPKGTRSVKATLELAFRGTGLEYEQVDSNVIISVGAAAVVSETSASLIQGTVKDDEGQVMPGVNIVVKGTTSGTTTDSEGRFAIDARPSDVLVFSFIGYKPQEVEVGSRSAIDIVMESDVEALKEVVVNAGYYQTTDKMKTGSIVRVAAKDIETQPVTSPLMALQGRMPGVEVTPENGVPGSAVRIRIRGQNSLRTGGAAGNGNLPLYIIDGIPIDSRPLTPSATSLVGEGFDPLSTINPANIESIEVLKDADATAIYGSRGANGVILITTKQGQKNGKLNLDVNAYKGAGKISNKMNLMDTRQYLEMRREAFANDDAIPGKGFMPDNDLLKWDTTRYTDWQDVLIGNTAQIEDMQLNVSGGNGTTSFRLGGGIHRETLVFPGDFGYRRITANYSFNHTSLNQKFRITTSFSYGSDRNNLFDDANVMNAALTLPPNAPAIYDSAGNLNWESSTWSNPIAAMRKTDKTNTDNLMANATLSYAIIRNLNLKVSLGYTNLNSTQASRYPLSSYNPAFLQYYTGASRDGMNGRKSWITEPQITYNKDFGSKNNLDVVLGTTWQAGTYQSQLVLSQGYTTDVLLGNIQAANSVMFERDQNSQYRYTAFFARLGYTWRGKYLFNATGRRDGSSRFGSGNKLANFGAVGAAWVFSNEGLVEDKFRFLSFGKLRASYGITGNDQIGDYMYYNTYSLTEWKYQGNVSLYPTALYNPDYAWEVTRKLEMALESSFLDSRISLDVSWYRNRSSNQLINTVLPYTTGFQSVFGNFGALVENRGWEFAVRTQNLRSSNFRWTTSFNISIPRNKLVRFPNLEQSSYASSYIVGKPVSITKLYTFKGVNSTTGLYQFAEDESTDNNRTTAIDFNRKYYGGLLNTLNFKSFELSFLFQFSKGNALNYSYPWPGMSVNQPVNVTARWQREGDISDVQRFSQDIFGFVSERYNRYSNSTARVGDASFIRLKTLSLSYSLPSSVLEKVRLEHAKIYLQGQNLFTVTNYDGLDPETLSALPPLRIVTIGLQLKL